MSNDSFNLATDSLIAPARMAFAITPNDATDLPSAAKALYVGSGGDITIRTVAAAEDVTLRNVLSGSVLAIRIRAVRQTGTTATDLVGLA